MVEEVLTVVLIGVVMLKQMFVISKEASGPRLHPRSDHATSTGVDSTVQLMATCTLGLTATKVLHMFAQHHYY